MPPRGPFLKPAEATGVEQNENARTDKVPGQLTRHGAQDASNSVKDCSIYFAASARADRFCNARARAAAVARSDCQNPAQPGTIATARVQPAEPRCTFTGKQTISKPSGGSSSRLCSFSRCE